MIYMAVGEGVQRLRKLWLWRNIKFVSPQLRCSPRNQEATQTDYIMFFVKRVQI